jgi:UbiA prenyltransferase family
MRSIIQHLRFHFSFFLMPVFWFVYSQATNPDISKAIWAFIILHLMVYPASNAYNSYFDKDEGPIGGVEKPLPVNIQLYYAANLIDVLAIILAYFYCSPIFSCYLLVYIFISKAYSHPIVRLKKYPFLSWFIVGLFQGAFVYLSVNQLINSKSFFDNASIIPSLLASFNLWAFYPITQIYQHAEDAKRGDITLSLKLGIRGTFIFTALLFLISTMGFYALFHQKGVFISPKFLTYLICMAPSLIFYNYWMLKAWKNELEANFKNTMMMNLLGSACLNIFFLWLVFWK